VVREAAAPQSLAFSELPEIMVYHHDFSLMQQPLTASRFHPSEAMSKEIRSPRSEALRKLLKLERQKAELTQAELAQRLGWDQRTISDIETGAKRVTVIELIELGDALGFDAPIALRRIAKVRD
jgi:DNA-binding XRE family transcriptional regulator